MKVWFDAPEEWSEWEAFFLEVLDRGGEFFQVPSQWEVSLSILDNQGVQDLNREYRGKDQPTDVLSFALDEGEEEAWEEEIPRLLGEIAISWEKGEDQAQEYGHSLRREMGFLAIHGLLHLLGWDHQSESEAKEMEEVTEKILASLGLSRGGEQCEEASDPEL